VVRFPYNSGDLEASGKPQTIVAGIPSSHHWTRDIAFSLDGKTLYLSIGSGSNVAQDIGSAPDGGLDAWTASAPLGAAWGSEQGRSARLRAGRQRRARGGDRPAQLLRHDGAAGNGRAVVRRQRARRARRQRSVRICNDGAARRVLWLAMALYRRA